MITESVYNLKEKILSHSKYSSKLILCIYRPSSKLTLCVYKIFKEVVIQQAIMFVFTIMIYDSSYSFGPIIILCLLLHLSKYLMIYSSVLSSSVSSIICFQSLSKWVKLEKNERRRL